LLWQYCAEWLTHKQTRNGEIRPFYASRSAACEWQTALAVFGKQMIVEQSGCSEV